MMPMMYIVDLEDLRQRPHLKEKVLKAVTNGHTQKVIVLACMHKRTTEQGQKKGV